MPEQVISPTAPPAIVANPTGASGGDDEFFAPQMMEKLNEAFAKAKPDEFKAKLEPARIDGSVSDDPASLPRKEAETAPKAPTKAADSQSEKPPAKAAQWKEVNEERTRLKEENAKYKADLEKYVKEQEKWKSWETERNQYETIKQHNVELLNRMQQFALEKDPRFENHFKAKTDTAIALAKQAVGDVHAERVSKLLALPDSDWRTEQLETVMSEIGTTRQARLGAAIVEMDRINLERNVALSKSKENWELKQKADQDERQNQKQQFERTFQDRLQAWSDPEKGLALFQQKDGDEAHNIEVQKRVEKARSILNMNLSADEFSKAALWASAAPGLLKDLLAERTEKNQLKAELEALKACGPELQGGGEAAPVDDEKQYEGMSMGEIIALKVQKAGGYQ